MVADKLLFLDIQYTLGILLNVKTGINVAALNPNEFLKFKLAEVRDINHNTKVYR